MVVNSFGALMQSTQPLYDQTITTAVKGAVWYAMAASVMASLVGLMIAGRAVAAGTGIAAIVKGIECVDAPKPNPSVLQLSIHMALEECSVFILGVICMAAERDNDAIYQNMLEHLEEQFQDDKYTKRGYIKAYYELVSLRLATDITDLKIGLVKHSGQLRLNSRS